MKKTLCAIVLLALLASPVFAQGPFTDVPTDHWAYQAVDQLTKDGIIVGYPDGTFGGKRAMTRFEFAQALARAIPVIVAQVQPAPPAGGGASQADLDALKGRVTALENKQPEVTKADLAAIQKMVDEFKDELTAMGVDIDALKRDVADLNKRLTALEEEVRRVRIGGTVNAFAVFEKTRDGVVTDRDNRDLFADDNLLENIAVIKEADITIDGRISDKAKAHVLLSAGDYLPYLDFVDDYQGGNRPLSGIDSSAPGAGLGTVVFPYYAYLDWNFGPGALTVGRFPMQWSPYTLKLIDVDSYTVNAKTDSGDYPLDGIKGSWKFGGVGLQLMASKTDGNAWLANGLTSQPFSGLYDTAFGKFNDFGGAAFGGLTLIEQVAGARVSIGTPLKGSLNGTYLRGSQSATAEQAELIGADLSFQLGKLAIGGEWAQTELTDSDVLDNDNTAIDGNLGIGFGALGIKAGWKSIGHNFTAPGFWDKLGQWTNPTNIEGPYVDLDYGLGANLKLVAGAEFLSGKDALVGAPLEIDTDDDDIKYYTAGLKWGMSSSTSVDLGLEWVKWEPSGLDSSDEKYINIGLGYQFNPNMMAKIGYQIIDFNAGADGHSYSAVDYKGDVAVAQFMVKF